MKRYGLSTGSPAPQPPQHKAAPDQSELAARAEAMVSQFDQDGDGSLQREELDQLVHDADATGAAEEVFHAVGRAEKALGPALYAKLKALDLGALKQRAVAVGAAEDEIHQELTERDYSTPEAEVIIEVIANKLVARFVMKTGVDVSAARVWLENAGEAEGEAQVLELALSNQAAEHAKKLQQQQVARMQEQERSKAEPPAEPPVASPNRPRGHSMAAMQRLRSSVKAGKVTAGPGAPESLMPDLNLKSKRQTSEVYAASMARQQQMAAASPLLRGNAATLSKTLDHVLQTKQQVRTRRV